MSKQIALAGTIITLASYWVSVLLGTFISANAVSMDTESPIILLGTLMLLIGSLIYTQWLPPPTSQTHAPTHQNLQAEWRAIRNSLPPVVAISSLVFLFHVVVWGVNYAGDGGSFLIHYLQLNDADPAYYNLQVYWPPLTGLVYGLPLSTGSIWPVVLIQYLLHALATIGIYWAMYPFGRTLQYMVIIFWWFTIPLQQYFHLIGADALMVATIIFWVWSVRIAYTYPQHQRYWLLLGASIGLNALVRGANVLLLVSFAPALLMAIPWSKKIQSGLLTIAGVAFFLIPLVIYNGVRYDVYRTARGSNTILFSASYIPESIVEPSNGDASQKLATLIETNILTTDLYQGVTLEQFLTTPSSRTWDDTLSMVDRVEGWDSEYALLQSVGLEAIQAHPIEFIRINGTETAFLLIGKFPLNDDGATSREPITFVVQGVYSSFLTSHPNNQLPDPNTIQAMQTQLADFSAPINTLNGNAFLQDTLSSQWNRWGWHPVVAWITILLVVWQSSWPERRTWLALLLGTVAITTVSALVIAQLRYRLPFDTVYIIMLAIGLHRLIQRQPLKPSLASHTNSA